MSEQKLPGPGPQDLERVCLYCYDLLTGLLKSLGREDLKAVVQIVKIKERGEER
jgi:hypothetical protein